MRSPRRRLTRWSIDTCAWSSWWVPQKREEGSDSDTVRALMKAMASDGVGWRLPGQCVERKAPDGVFWATALRRLLLALAGLFAPCDSGDQAGPGRYILRD